MTTAPNLFAPLQVIWRRRLVVALVVVAGGAALAFLLTLVQPKFVATSTVLLVADGGAQGNQPGRNAVSPATKPLLYNDLTALVTSTTVLEKLKQRLGISEKVDKLKPLIKAKAQLNSNVMPISFSGATKSQAIIGANLLADETTSFYRNIATKRFDSLIADFSGQLTTRGAELQRLDRQLQEMAGSYPFVDTKDGEQSVYDRLIKLTTEQQELAATVKGDLAQSQAITKVATAARPVGIRDVVENDPVYKNVETNYARDLARMQQQQASVSDLYPGLAELKEITKSEARQADAARARAAASGPGGNITYATAQGEVARMRAQLAADQAKESAVRGELDTLRGLVGGGKDASRVSQLRRDRDAVQDAYSVLQSRYSQALADRSEAASTGSLVVIDRAKDAAPSLGTMAIVAIAALVVVTLWAAITLAYLFDAQDRRFVDRDSIESIYGTPVVSSLR